MQGNPASPPGIEGVKMRKVYYNSIRNRELVLTALALPLLALTLSATRQQPALKTASLESHEGLTISARPWTDPALYKEKFPKKSPLSGGVLAVQVAFRNDSEESIKVDLQRIRLNVMISEDNPQALPALTPDEAADAILAPVVKDPTSSRRKFPFPIGKSKPPGRDKKWYELQTALGNAGVPSPVIASHSTVQGLLYFDLQGQFDLLHSSHLYVPDVVSMKDQHAILYFEIDLSRPSAN